MNRTNRRCASALPLFVALLCATSPQFARAQQTSSNIRYELFADSPGESYLRYLQTTGVVPLYPWAARSFSQRELKTLITKDTLHPWSQRLRDESSSSSYGIRYGLIQPSASMRYNSSFAYGSNDGPIWAGRGLTSAVQAGFYATWGPA